MRNVVLYHLLSLDGIALDDDAEWFTDSGPEMFANLARVIGTQSDILLGRRTYDYWVGYWPTSDIEPFATFINQSPKHVVTSSTPGEEWANTTLVTTSAADYVSDLKQQPGGDIGIHGSIDLASSLLRAGLVDVLELAVAPATAGCGRRVFESDDASQRWDLTNVERSPLGTLFLTYRSADADAVPAEDPAAG
jgi:dihydrofolate reductase